MSYSNYIQFICTGSEFVTIWIKYIIGFDAP
jgi:hypothetical protein